MSKTTLMTEADIKAATQNLIEKTIHTNALEDAISRMSATHAMAGIRGTGMLILGSPGLGKTKIIDTYVERYYASRGSLNSDTVTIVPVVKIPTPSPPRIKLLIGAILECLGHPNLSGSQLQLEFRLGQIIKNQKVEMLIFDEFQHLLPNQAGMNTRHVVNFIKVLMDRYKLAVVMAGLEEAVHSIGKYEELNQRFSYERVRLKPFDVSTKHGIREFGHYIKGKELIMRDAGVVMVDLKSESMLQRLYIVTKGIPRLINMFFEKVLQRCDLSQCVTVDDFKDVYTNDWPLEHSVPFNPFAVSSAEKLREKSGWLHG